MTVGMLKVILGLDSKGFETGINTVTGKTTLLKQFTDKTFKAIGTGIKIGMAAAGAAMIKAVIDFGKFEQQLANVSTMLSAETLPMMSTFKEELLTMSETFGESTATLSKGLYDILSASIPASEALDVLEVSTKAARAGLSDTGTAADAITTLINSFGDATKDASYYADIMFASVKLGKCVTGDTRILLADGSYPRIDSLSGKMDVVSWDYKTFTPTEAEFIDMGTKQIVEIETKNGRQIRTTPEHPYLTVNGWKKVSELKIGDKIAVPTGLPFFGTVEPEEGFAELLGLLLAEGSLNGSTAKLTIGNEHTNKIAKEACKKYGIGYVKVNQTDKEKCDIYCLSDKNNKRIKNKLTERLRGLGVWGETCYTKHIPDEVFRWKKEYVAKFLNAYFTGDGWLCSSGKTKTTWQLGCCSVSRTLLNDISHLLLRFGINGIIRQNSTDAYIWQSTRFIEIKRFMEFIGIQRDGLDVFNKYIPTRAPHQYEGLTTKGIRTTEYKKYNRYKGIKAEDSLLEYVEIKTLDYQNEERVYDLMVPILHNFVANDILAHNTTFNEMAGSVGNVATLFATAGGSAEELAGMISILTRNGVDTHTAMTNIKGIVSALLKPSDELTAALEGMTVEGDGFAAIMEKVSKFPPADLAKMFPNVRALTGVVIAAKDLGEEVETINGLMAGGTLAQEAYEKNTDTLAFKWAQLKETFKSVSIQIGEKLAPQLKAMFEDMISWVKENKDNILNFFSGFATALENTVRFVIQFKEMFVGLIVAISAYTIIDKAAKALQAFGLATTLTSGPIGALAVGIGLLVAGIMKLKQLTNEYKDDTERLNAALDGSATSVEEYNAAAEIQAKRMDMLKAKLEQNQKSQLGIAKLTQDQIALSQQWDQQKLNAAQEELKRIEANKQAFIKAEEEKQKNAEAASKAELERQFAEQRAIIEKEMLEQQTEAERRARADQIAEIDKQLADLRMTDIERIEARKRALQDMGYTEEDIILLLKKEYKEYYDEIDEKATESLEAMKLKSNIFTRYQINEAIELEKAKQREYEERQRIMEAFLPYENKLVQDSAKQQTKDRAMSYVEDWQNNTKHVDKLKYTWLDFTNDLKENWQSLTNTMANSFKEMIGAVVTLLGYETDEMIDDLTEARDEALALVEEQYAGMTAAEQAYQDFLDEQSEKRTKAKEDELAQLKEDIKTELDEKKKLEMQKRIEELTTELEGERLAKEAADAKEKAAKEEADAKAEIQAEYEADVLELKKEAWKKEKKLSKAMAIIDTANAVIAAAQTKPWWAALIAVAAATALGVAQIAVIDNQPAPFIRGGMVGGGVFEGDPGIDTNDVSLTSGEYVMPPQQTRDNINDLEAMRDGTYGGGGNLNISATPVNIYLDSEKVGEGMLEFFTDQSDKGTYRINPKVIGVA